MDTIDIAGLEGGTVSVSLDSLRADLAGPILQPGDGAWEDAVLIWNAMAASTPALVVRPASSADVATVVGFAAAHGLRLAIKGGGHNIAGTALAEAGLNLEMSLLRDVEVDPATKRARVGAGCLLRHVDAATQQHGLAAVLGFVSETGVAGLTLGGGIGYLTRRFGWTVDTLEEVEVVTADGVVRTANRDENADLFWGLRGGGGNLGVVTRFTFRLFDVGPSITGGLIAWPADRCDEVLAAYRDLTETAPRECTAFCSIRLAPPVPFLPPEWHGKPIVAVGVCHSGPNPEADLVALRALGDPIADVIMEKPYTAQQSMLDAAQPKGAHYYWKNEFVGPQSTEFLDAFRSAALGVTSPMAQSVMFHLAGRVNELAADDGAVGNRDAHYFTAFAGAWPATDERGAEHVAWVRRSWEAIRPYSTGGSYVNFQPADEDSARTAASYGANFERLQRIKASYDPYNLFRVNRNVSPAHA